ncbi:dynein axonemal heavy chain 12-like [Amphiura filiformis]|uniref:dynein axonemal heavy chain 12-like n=1 Tax=Amphiura filiformis TaxID=82378 RepID=UPI003B2253C2
MDFTEAYSDRCSSVGHAARIGNVSALTKLIQSGSSVDVKDNRGWTPLHEAAAHGQLKCVQLLIPHLEVDDINCRSFEGETPLWLAAKKGHHPVVLTLVETAADPNISNNEEGSPLLQAVAGNHQECVDILLQHGANIRCQFCNGWSLMHEVACQGNTVMARHLLDAGAPLDLADDFGIKPVFTAAQYGRVECLRLILERGGDANTQAYDKATPLYLAAQEDYPQCIEVLLSHGANANLETEDGLKPLHAAAHKGHERCARQLYPQTTIPPQTAPYTPLHFACAQGHIQVIKYLLEAGCDVNTGLKKQDVNNKPKKDGEGVDEEHMNPEAPLLDAIENQHLNIVKCLLENGAKTECLEMFCPLKTAFPSEPLLRMLLEHGCSVNCGHVSKGPELLCENQDLKAVKFLLHCGMELDLSCLHEGNGCCLGVLTSSNTDFMATLVKMAAEFTDNLHLCCHLVARLLDTSHWDQIKNLIENPPSLQHLSRITIRRLVGSKRLLNPENIMTLPITRVTKEYLLYKE